MEDISETEAGNLEIYIIGIGGIGGILTDYIWKSTNSNKTRLHLIDADKYEFRNLERQFFNKMGYKVNSKKEELQKDPSNQSEIYTYIHNFPLKGVRLYDGAYVFSCVDNHYARKQLDDIASKMKNITVISGGNEYTDGNVQFFVRKDGKLVAGNYLDSYHPEIANAEPEIKTPGCDLNPDPQLLVTNANVAVIMFNIFHCLRTGVEVPYSEVYFDVLKNSVVPVSRKMIKKVYKEPKLFLKTKLEQGAIVMINDCVLDKYSITKPGTVWQVSSLSDDTAYVWVHRQGITGVAGPHKILKDEVKVLLEEDIKKGGINLEEVRVS